MFAIKETLFGTVVDAPQTSQSKRIHCDLFKVESDGL